MDDLLLSTDPGAELLRTLREIGEQQREALKQIGSLSHEVNELREALAQSKKTTGTAIAGLDERGAQLEERIDRIEGQRWTAYGLFLLCVIALAGVAALWQIAPALRLLAAACGIGAP